MKKINKLVWWKKGVYGLLLLVFLAIGGSIWNTDLPTILTFLIFLIAIIAVYYFWDKINDKGKE